ncbi:hypothetical protein Taro_045034 [Colocasia esculenta]|uniref:Uncharacterized protein n=1 Tax=Colocasia esculenta TaxID=4460 RepID=A0A843X1Z2_COLES|nr:hypothetical protein [Colocasia esculenta]
MVKTRSVKLQQMKMRDGKGSTANAYYIAKYEHKWIRTWTIIDNLYSCWNEHYKLHGLKCVKLNAIRGSHGGSHPLDVKLPLIRYEIPISVVAESYLVGAMASRGRRGGVPAREGELRHEDRAEQQAPAPQGPVLPPPPPVDYGVFMQGLVQAMQT